MNLLWQKIFVQKILSVRTLILAMYQRTINYFILRTVRKERNFKEIGSHSLEEV